mmetsp:Transcript_26710/g.64082  ORF Transcript_26710/g.64082 Transcript_26710/m.64082 type:complete len:606 (-) Transcript_26710:81-1898(-)
MGGEAAKERRRLKRLEAQKTGDGKAPSGAPHGQKSIDKKRTILDQTKVTGEKDSGAGVRQRLQRKMARKASGKFKAQSQSERPPTSNRAHTRKPQDADNYKHKDKAPRSHPPSKAFKGGPKNQSFRQNSPKNKTNSRHEQDRQPLKKKNRLVPKTKKPKHLKRKMDQLSKTITEGNNGAGSDTNIISELEGQMRLLAEQMEKFKKLKQKNVVADDKDIGKDEDVGKDGREEKITKVHQDDGVEGENSNKNEEKGEPPDHSLVEVDMEQIQSDEKEVKSKLSASSDNGSSSDDDTIVESSNARSRGKRRRGRRDSKPNDEPLEGEVYDNDGNQKDKNNSTDQSKANQISDSDLGHDSEPASKKTSKKDDKRRCVGRRPVTDYVIGKTYSGKVRYIKPKLGAFIDVGSHSDAFCHISCISNEFVSSVADILKIDDVVENARVVEIDREKKRITVSLRSNEMAENEQERLKITRQYEIGVKSRMNGYAWKSSQRNEGHVSFDGGIPSSATNLVDIRKNEDGPSALNSELSKSNAGLKRERKLDRRSQKEQLDHSTVDDFSGGGHGISALSSFSQSGPKTGADLKRERKLARRAERRAAMDAAHGNGLQ